MRGPLHPTRIDIPIEVRVQVIDVLNSILATFTDMASQLKQAHWNIKDSRFFMLHKLFDEMADPFPDYIDDIAERINQLGGTSLGTVRMAAISSTLPEFPYSQFDGDTYLEAIATRLAMVSKQLREGAVQVKEAGDPTTENYLLELAMDIDKWLWFTESHIS